MKDSLFIVTIIYKSQPKLTLMLILVLVRDLILGLDFEMVNGQYLREIVAKLLIMDKESRLMDIILFIYKWKEITNFILIMSEVLMQWM